MRKIFILAAILFCGVMATMADDSIVLTDFYNYIEEGSGFRVYLTETFKAQVNKSSGGEFTSGSYTWKTGDPLPDPAPDGMHNGRPVISLSEMFYNCSSLTSLDLSKFNTTNVTDISYIFWGCSSLSNVYLSGLKTDNISNMNGLFSDCSSIKDIDLSGFNTANVTVMYGLFSGCSSLTSVNLSSFNTDKVTDMSYMFEDCFSLTSLDLSNFNTANVTDMSSMFYDCYSLTGLDLSKFNTDKIESIEEMFYYCGVATNGNPAIGYAKDAATAEKFNNSELTGIDQNRLTFTTKGSANITITALTNGIAKGSVTGGASVAPGTTVTLTALANSGYKFTGWSNGVQTNPYTITATGNIDITANFEAIETGKFILSDFYQYSLIGSGYKVSLTPAFKIELDKASGGEFISNGIAWHTGDPLPNPAVDGKYNGVPVTSMFELFNGCSSMTTLNLSNFNTETITNMGYMFCRCSSLKSLDLSSFNTENVISMDRTFSYCSALTSLNLRSFNTAKVTGMYWMFYGCGALTSLDLSSFNTANVTNMSSLFQNCFSLTSLDLTSFNTTSVTDMSYMFQYCTSLTSIDLTSFNTANVSSMRQMFYYCKLLTSIDLTNFNTAKVTNMSQMFDHCTSLTSLDLSSFNIENIKNIANMFLSCGKAIGGVPATGYAKDAATAEKFNNSTSTGISSEILLFKAADGYTITVETDGNGTASANVTSATQESEITLIATPNSGYVFKEWQVISGGVAITDGKFTMPKSNVTVKAIFELAQAATYTITIQNDGNGSASASTTTAASGTEIVLYATPNEGYQLKEWEVISGGATITENKFAMPGSDVVIKAVFEKASYSIVVSASTSVATASASAKTAVMGTEITLSAEPVAGYLFSKWEVILGDITITDNKFTMPSSNVTISAIYERLNYNITVENDGNGTASANITTTIMGNTVKLSAKPNNGYIFKEWQIISGEIFIFNSQFTMPASNVTVKAIFEKVSYTITVENDGNGTASASAVSAVMETEISLTSTPNSGYKFKEWQVISGGVTVTSDKFTMPTNDVTVKAIFEISNSVESLRTSKTLQVRGEQLYNPTESEVTIYNIAGRKIFVSKDININLSGFVNGVYIASNKNESVKIVKRK